jgi:hypothetical protein
MVQLKQACLAAIVAGVCASAALADHMLAFHFRGVITRIEGTVAPPAQIRIGGPLSLEFVFLRAAVDSEPAPEVGLYPVAISAGEVLASDYHRYCRISAGSIQVIDNSALGDVYRASVESAADVMWAQVELVDTQSASFQSDVLPEDLSLSDYDDEFDWMTISIEVGTAESHWRIVGDIEFFQIGGLFSPCDFNFDGIVNTQDFFDFLTEFFAGAMSADYNGDGLVNSQDLFDFLVCFLSGCQ